MKRSRLTRQVIRSLRSGEPVPESAPRRYKSSHGYIRLRWLVAPNQYVETYEHRVVDGFVTNAEHVHHRNEDKADNSPENLAHLTAEEHNRLHSHRLTGRKPGFGQGKYFPYRGKAAKEKAERAAARRHERELEVKEMRRLYLDEGRTITDIGQMMGLHHTQISRRLFASGVRMRSKSDYAREVDSAEIRVRYEAGAGLVELAREYRKTSADIAGAIRAAGGRIRHVGRSKATPEERSSRLVIKRRSSGICERCASSRATDAHHRKNRSQGGQWAPANLMHLCSDCHRDVTVNPALSRSRGWSVLSTDDPTEMPVFLAGRGWVFLLEDGSTTQQESAA